MAISLDIDDLVLLKFTKNEENLVLRWEHSTEFEYNNEMYDIYKKKIVCDTTYYWCWKDNLETYIQKRFDELFANVFGNDFHNNNSQKRLSNIFKSLYYYKMKITNMNEMKSTLEYSYYSFSSISFLSSPPVPPPEIN